MRAVGVHIRVMETLLEVLEKAIRLQVPFFQCFLMQQQTRKMIDTSHAALKKIRMRRSYYTGDIYIHGSYYINLGQTNVQVHRLLQKEMQIAYELECNYMVLHAGYTKGSIDRLDGIDAMARVLNTIGKNSGTIPIIIENSAHAGMSLGSDFTDFQILKEKIDNPEQLLFCVDTAHAHAFGYDLVTANGQALFVQLLRNTIGVHAITLIHLNDTKYPRGSHIDHHAIPGSGLIGLHMLKQFISHKDFQDLRIILELPVMEEWEEEKIISIIRSW